MIQENALPSTNAEPKQEWITPIAQEMVLPEITQGSTGTGGDTGSYS
jgi:hypothetical protein